MDRMGPRTDHDCQKYLYALPDADQKNLDALLVCPALGEDNVARCPWVSGRRLR
jgi:hypothetical protein